MVHPLEKFSFHKPSRHHHERGNPRKQHRKRHMPHAKSGRNNPPPPAPKGEAHHGTGKVVMTTNPRAETNNVQLQHASNYWAGP